MMNRSPEKKTTAKPPQKASEKPDKPDKASPESSRGHGHGTRAAVLLEEELRAEKERYFSMPLDRKRKMYKCGDGKYVTLKEIPIWPELDSKRTPSSSKKSSKTSTAEKPEAPVPAVPKGRKRYAVNEELNRKVSLYRGDITTLEIDAIVNAANSSLMGGGGVDGAIHSAAGSFLKKECATLNGCDTGDAKITYGFKLPAKHVIHTVGPIGEKKDCLQSAYKRCLEVMKENKLTTVAFPCISTGIYGYPVESATHVALGTIREWLEKDKYCEKVERIILCVFLKRDVEVYEELLHVYFPLSEDRVEPDKADTTKEVPAPEPSPEKTPKELRDNTTTATTATTTTATTATTTTATTTTNDTSDTTTATTTNDTTATTTHVTTITVTAKDASACSRLAKVSEEPMEEEEEDAKGDNEATSDHSSPAAARPGDEPMEGDGKREGEKDGEREKGSRKKNKGEETDRKEEEGRERDGKKAAKV